MCLQTGAMANASTTREIVAQVVSVDQANRQVTLRGPNGNPATIDVPPDVRNFSQISPGDRVRLTYRARLDILVAGSNVPVRGVEVSTGAVKSEPGEMPSGILGRQTRRTVQVVSVDRPTHTVTFREPDGSINTFTAVNPDNFLLVDGLKPGTNILVTVIESVAGSVERVS